MSEKWVKQGLHQRVSREIATGVHTEGHQVSWDYTLLPGSHREGLNLDKPKVDFEALSSNQEVAAKLKKLRNFVEIPILNDNFPSNSDIERDTWEKKITNAYSYYELDGESTEAPARRDSLKFQVAKKILDANRYRVNELGQVLQAIDLMSEEDPTGQHDIKVNEAQRQLFQTIKDQLTPINRFPANLYKELSHEYKNKIVSQFTLAALSSLQVLSTSNLAEQNLIYIKDLKKEIETALIQKILEALKPLMPDLVKGLKYLIIESRNVEKNQSEALDLNKLNEMRTVVYYVVSYVETLQLLLASQATSLDQADRHVLNNIRMIFKVAKSHAEKLDSPKLNVLKVFLDRLTPEAEAA